MKLFNKLIEKIKVCIQGYLLYRMFEKDGQVKIVESEEQENAWIYFTNNSIFPWRLLFLSNIIWIDWLYNRKIKRSQRKQGRKMIEKMKVAPNTNRGAENTSKYPLIIDWLTVSGHFTTFEEMIEFLGLKNSGLEFKECPPRWF